MAEGERGERISVSRDALRAELAEMELRLRTYFDVQLGHKADKGDLLQVVQKVDALRSGDLTEAHKRSVVSLIDERLGELGEVAWSRRDRVVASLAAFAAVGMLTLYVLAAFRGGSP